VNILVVAAHPDDEVLGCGGTIARRAADGDDVYISIFGEGITSRYTDRADAEQELLTALHGDSRRVADQLGARDLFMYNLPDNRFDTVPLLDVVKIIEELVDRLKPEVIYTHHAGDLNIDHVVLNRAVMTATRPVGGSPVRSIYCFEVASSTEWAFGQYGGAFRPNVYVDIAGTLERKITAMEAYESEARPFPHPRSPEALRAIAQRWGSQVGLQAAEVFELVRSIE
jgi:LmbE family N-acetylglucosaminyl deacetylase